LVVPTGGFERPDSTDDVPRAPQQTNVVSL
jgi:hypothetical protein